VDWAVAEAKREGALSLLIQLVDHGEGQWVLEAYPTEGVGAYWRPGRDSVLDSRLLLDLLLELANFAGQPILLLAHGPLVGRLRELELPPSLRFFPQIYPPRLLLPATHPRVPRALISPHLQRLESESIHILREAVAEAERPVMLYSVGKDSGVMLHLARKAFYPAIPPFPLLHVDTRWKFQEMYLFRQYVMELTGMRMLRHVNPDAIARDINPFDHGSSLHTDITKTEGLRQALDEHRFDVIFGGARRDEEKSRAKERIFSFRTASHRWDPKNQRPELWNLYNARRKPGESIRVFPLSNWTELDIWQYIYQEGIPVVPLYFARWRPVVERDGMLLMIDDGRFRLAPGEQIEMRRVRFRTLGCYPLTGAIESEAETIEDILQELIHTRNSERQGRRIDADGSGSMERKKQEGYF
jgi:sulfate adenylyltransferase subunit 2